MLQCRCDISRLETKGTRFALPGDAPVPVDHIEAVRPCRVSPLRGIVKIVNEGRKLNPEILHAGTRHGAALIEGARCLENNIFFHVDRHLPDIAGVRFFDVDHVKLYLLLVLLIQPVQGRNLPPEWGSRVAAKNQHHRFLATKRGKLHARHLIERLQTKIGRRIPGP